MRPRRWRRWALAGGGGLVALGIIGAVVLGILGPSGPPIGREVARHTYEGNVYVLVEYGDRLAVFSGSGAPVRRQGLAEGVLRSYAWRQVIADFDTDGLANVSEKASRLDDDVSHVRSLSNDVVSLLDELEDVKARVPLLGSISAMDVIAELFPGVGDAEDVIRSLDAELNELGETAALLARASKRIADEDLSSVSGDMRYTLCSLNVGGGAGLEGFRSNREGLVAGRQGVGWGYGGRAEGGFGHPDNRWCAWRVCQECRPGSSRSWPAFRA